MRNFGTELSANIQSIRGNRKHLTPVERASIFSARMAGVTRKVLAAEFGCSLATISKTCKRIQLRRTVETKPRSGRPRKLSPSQARYMVQLVKRNPRMSWAALLGACPRPVVKSTLRKVLGPHYRRKYRSIKRIMLDQAKATNRLQHVKALKRKVQELMEVSASV